MIYDKNISKKTAKEKFIKLAIEDCIKCVEVVSNYVKSTPNKTFRKHVSTWLNQECWNDEIVVVEECCGGSEGVLHIEEECNVAKGTEEVAGCTKLSTPANNLENFPFDFTFKFGIEFVSVYNIKKYVSKS